MKETAGCGRHENETNIFVVPAQLMTGLDRLEGLGVGYLYRSKKVEYCVIVMA
jgi:hypothetical protein